MSSLRHNLWRGLLAVCLLCISICGTPEAASPDEGMQAFRSAYFVSGQSADRMKRVPFMSGGYNEAWLQKLIENHPDMLS